MGKVTSLKAANDAPAAVADDTLPPFDIGIVMNLSGERQITVRSPVTEPISKAEADRRMDGLVRVAERQRSLYELRFLTEQLEDKTAALEGVWKKRQAEAEAKHKEALAELERETTQAMAKREQLQQRVARQWRDRGKQGDPVLQGADKSTDQGLARDIEAKGDRVKKLEAEHLQHMQTITGNVEKLTEEIAAIGRLIAKHREIVG